MTQSTWQVFQLNELLQRIDRGGVRLHEFLRTPSLSCAIYHLPAGSNEMATAHEEDELYFVLEGRARLRVDDQDHAVEKGTLLYVEAACDHSFSSVWLNSSSVRKATTSHCIAPTRGSTAPSGGTS